MSPSTNRPLALIILDGWGFSNREEGNAIALAHTPFYDQIRRDFPMTTLVAAGSRVGQAPEASGSPEIGHMNIGTGRTARSESVRILESIRNGEFAKNEVLLRAIGRLASNGRSLHLIGMLSDGGVHSSTESLFALLRMAKNCGVTRVFVHCILDGVDVPPRTADIYVEALEIKLADIGVGQIATLCGRHLAMDSRGNWERTARAFTMMVHGEGERSNDAVNSIRNSFLRGIADEFISPIVLESAPDVPLTRIENGDAVVFFNHRAEGIRQLVRSLSVADTSGSAKPVIDTVCLVEYDKDFDLPVAFEPEPATHVLTDVLAEAGIASVRITQSERFPHVTHFFNGGAIAHQQNEHHILLPTPRDESVEQRPESQSFKIVDKFIQSLDAVQNGVFVVNLPAADLVAETGRLDKTIEAVQYVDTCLGGIVEHVQAASGVAIVTSSHGNCEEMTNLTTGEPHYLTTANQVPFHIISGYQTSPRLRTDGTLADVAPTILSILGVERPESMTGRDLLVQE